MPRQLRFGARPLANNQTEFRVWASKARSLQVEIVERDKKRESVRRTVPLVRDAEDVFAGIIDECPPGTLYRYQINNQPGRPDPYSRFQPSGVHGPSQVIDPHQFRWTDQDWLGIAKQDLVVYELHVGSLTKTGTYRAAIDKLPELKQLGITAIELLPLAQSPGRWNWGYDGVNYFAPRNSFGTPDDLRALIDAAHGVGLAVIHDVVYNHVGPEGNYLNEFAHYRSPKHGTPWGDSLNFDGPQGARVREFVIENGLYWLDEFHFDGLRLDAIHYMFDESDHSIVHELRAHFREYEKTVPRKLYLIAESNIFDQELLHDASNDGANYDAIWSDCLMHSIYSHGNPEIRLTNRQYLGSADLAEALEHAFVFSAPQAIRVDSEFRKQLHPAGERDYISSLIMALQTHDSVGNHPHGARLHQLMGVDFQRAAAPLILLYPSIPMIFMGEEWAANSPFPFFADFEDAGLRAAVDKGRRDEYPHHDWADSPLPSDPAAFYCSKLDESSFSLEMRVWYQQLLSFRRRGLEEGWLAVSNLQTAHDAAQDIFKLIFRTPRGRIVVAARLAMRGADAIRLTVRQPIHILLDSRMAGMPDNTASAAATAIELHAQQCCVWLEPLDF